jgi:hypothetical protein
MRSFSIIPLFKNGYLIRAVSLLQYSFDMLAPGVGNENLSELLAGNQPDDMAYALGVEFVENIIEQEDGHDVATMADKIEIG